MRLEHVLDVAGSPILHWDNCIGMLSNHYCITSFTLAAVSNAHCHIQESGTAHSPLSPLLWWDGRRRDELHVNIPDAGNTLYDVPRTVSWETEVTWNTTIIRPLSAQRAACESQAEPARLASRDLCPLWL